MKLFACQACGQSLYFESTKCERCERALGFLPEQTRISALKDAGESLWAPLADPDTTYRYCANQEYGACQWLVKADSDENFCVACRLNRTIPDLSIAQNLSLYQQIEVAKHRLVYSLIRFRLPIENKVDDVARGLAFDFLADNGGEPKVLTGHAEGVITLNIAEADSAQRERMRQNMQEPYRTVLGHMRHEIAHYYWERLIQDSKWLGPVRKLFGDETVDYGEALQTHYEQGAPKDWQENYVSSYASSHPWEDWAETWAHYFHMVDTLETAHAFGLQVRPRASTDDSMDAKVRFDPYRVSSFDLLIETWLPVSFAMNSLNRSMGHVDLYPFILSPPVLAKLKLIHDIME